MRTITYNVMDYQEFDALVNEHILSANGKYEFIAEEELANDSSHSYTVEPMDMSDDSFDKKFTLPDILAGKLIYRAGSIMNYLCHLGVIEPGNYLIEVFW